MKASDFTAEQLAGRWRTRQAAYGWDWLLRVDGTFTADISEHGVTISRPIGTWSIESDELVSVYSDDEFDLIGRGQRDRDRLLEVTEEYFILTTRQGIRRRYERVHEKRVAMRCSEPGHRTVVKCDLDESTGHPTAVLFWPSSSDGRYAYQKLDPEHSSPTQNAGLDYIYTGDPSRIEKLLAEMRPAPLSDDGFSLGFFFLPGDQ